MSSHSPKRRVLNSRSETDTPPSHPQRNARKPYNRHRGTRLGDSYPQSGHGPQKLHRCFEATDEVEISSPRLGPLNFSSCPFPCQAAPFFTAMLKLCCRFLAQPAEMLQLESFEGQSGPLGFSGTLPCSDAKLTEPSQVRNLEP